MDTAELKNRFAFHPAVTSARRELHEDVRYRCWDLANWINQKVPEGREKSLAVTHLEDVMMWANAAVARTGDS